jgi:hypothetical protein
MIFCDKCRNIFDISNQKDIKNRQVGGKIKRAVANLFKKHEEGTPLTDEDLEKLTSKDLLYDEDFGRMSKRAQQKMISWIKTFKKEWFTNDDEDEEEQVVDAYFVCKSCRNTAQIEPGAIICYKSYGIDEASEVEEYAQFIHDQTLPRTRTYICPNKKCTTHKSPDTKEAVITKNYLHQCIYVCTQCATNWVMS